ncbi:MAG: 50S ribosomal protein L6 [Candidatus Omnitrophica bacterium]|nr:50S ribosomal protein L6 [Candidatus Omnitrophota bacterium]
MSRIGKKSIQIPSGVKLNVTGCKVAVEGPKGRLDYTLPADFKTELKDGRLTVLRPSDSKKDMSLHGLARSMINNMIKGVTEGFVKTMEIQGVGYRAQLQGKTLVMQLGFTHAVNFQIPDGIVIEVPKPTDIIVRGIDKQKVGQAASNIRSYYKPEPYKGKGIRYTGEYVRKKAGKAVA